MLTDTRFWLGVGAGAVLVMFVIPYVKGAVAARNGG